MLTRWKLHPRTLAFNPSTTRQTGSSALVRLRLLPAEYRRVLTSLGHYIYTVRPDTLFINLYVNEVTIPVGDETLKLRISGNYPWQEEVNIEIASPVPVTHTSPCDYRTGAQILTCR